MCLLNSIPFYSTDGGRTFNNIEMEIGKEAIRSSNGVFKSPVDPKRVSLLLDKYNHTFKNGLE